MEDMNMKEYISQAEKDLLHTYNRYQKVWDHGEGVYLYDTDGGKYLDFVAGIAVFALGYGNQEYNPNYLPYEKCLRLLLFFLCAPLDLQIIFCLVLLWRIFICRHC